MEGLNSQSQKPSNDRSRSNGFLTTQRVPQNAAAEARRPDFNLQKHLQKKTTDTEKQGLDFRKHLKKKTDATQRRQDFDIQNILEKKASATEKHQSSYLKEHLKTKAAATTLGGSYWEPHLRFDANSSVSQQYKPRVQAKSTSLKYQPKGLQSISLRAEAWTHKSRTIQPVPLMQLERHLIQPKTTKRFSWGPEAPRGGGPPHVLRMAQGQLPGRLRGAPPVEKAHVYLPEERHTPTGTMLLLAMSCCCSTQTLWHDVSLAS